MIAVAVLLTHTAAAQKYLELQSAKEQQDKYGLFLRKVFSRMYRQDVVLSVLCIPSFVPEHGAGILKTPDGYAVFSLTPSASVWQTEYHSIIRRFDEHNREIRWKPADNIKEGLPVSYRDIVTRMQAQPVSADLAERITQLWQDKLLQALNPPPGPRESAQYIVLDGVRYRYSMPLKGHGWVAADGKLILEGTPVWLMGELAEALSAYAKGKISEDRLRKALQRVEPKKA